MEKGGTACCDQRKNLLLAYESRGVRNRLSVRGGKGLEGEHGYGHGFW